jgi:hypothetical protein
MLKEIFQEISLEQTTSCRICSIPSYCASETDSPTRSAGRLKRSSRPLDDGRMLEPQCLTL